MEQVQTGENFAWECPMPKCKCGINKAPITDVERIAHRKQRHAHARSPRALQHALPRHPHLCAPPLSAARSAPPHLLLLRTFASTPPSLLPNASICALPSLRRASTRLRLMAWGNPRPRCHPPCDGLPLSSTLRCASPARRTAPSASTPRRACVMLLCHACGVHTRTKRKTAHHSHLPPAHSGGAGRHAGCHRAACRDTGGACGSGGGSRRHPAAVGSA